MMDIEHISKSYGPEMGMIILTGRLYFNTASAIEVNTFISNHNINWALVERIIKIHQVRPIVYKTISLYSINVDKQFLEKIKNDCTHIAAGNLSKTTELVRLHTILKKHNIQNIPYKGVILSQLLFGDYISRETSDIDFMINPHDFDATRTILLQEGYVIQYYYNPGYEKLFIKSDNELLFVKETHVGNIKVEIHWAITHKMMAIPMKNEEIFSHTSGISMLGENIDVFNSTGNLLALLVHHGVNDVWGKLRHVLDISLLVHGYESKIDWEELNTLTQKHKIYKASKIGFSLCEELFGVKVPLPFVDTNADISNIVHNVLRFPPIKRKKLSMENIRQQFALRDSFADKLRLLSAYVSTSIMPNIRDVEAYPLPPQWSVLYIFIKPFRVLFGSQKKG